MTRTCGVYALVLLAAMSAVNGKVDLILTDCETVALEFHVTRFTIRLSAPISKDVNVTLVSSDHDIAFPLTEKILFTPQDDTKPRVIQVYGNNVGDTYIDAKFNSSELILNKKHDRVHVLVVHSRTLNSVISVIGWIYFLAWSVSFYPQVYVNYKRKSVVGLNFDFLCYNLTGFLAYSFFNVGLFWVTSIQNEYFAKYGGSVIPVQPNDVFFALHAVLLTIITISQCFIYDRGTQKISIICIILVIIAWLFAACSLVPAILSKITWLTYLDFFSYIKLGVTLIKYVPQAYMNFRRKSTVGWSIGNVLLDFTGGSFSLIQMFLLAYNNNEWNSIFGDFTKFGLGFFSILFDILFIVQHYVLYRKKTPYEPIVEDEQTDPSVNAIA